MSRSMAPALWRPDSRLWRPNRRSFLQALGGSAAALAALGPTPAHAAGTADNILFFYFPDGVPGWSQNGDASLWHCTGGETDFSLGHTVQALAPFRDRCLFFNGLTMGDTDNGSHPGGAKKLLTASDHGNNESIDQHLSRSVGSDRPWHHLYLGAQAGADGASGDKFITYPVAGSTMAPEDDPRRAFSSLFGSGGVSSGGSGSGDDGGSTETDPAVARRLSVLDASMGEIHDLKARLGTTEKRKLDLHLESLYELEGRLNPGGSGGGSGSGGTDWGGCDDPSVEVGSLTDSNLYDPALFPDIISAQIDIAVQAMACGMTRVVTLQCSHHTSDLIMSRFPGSEMYDPGYDMRSHQASHYGSGHDWGSREFAAFDQQRRYWVDRFVELLTKMDSIPGRTGTLLDDSIVVLCTEVCDGNTHQHHDLPVVVAGGGGGALHGGRLLNTGGRYHGDLWVALGRAMGEDMWSFGSSGSVLDGVLT
mgnify:FL=1